MIEGMKTHRVAFAVQVCLALAGVLLAGAVTAQDLLGSTRTQMLARFGHPMFSPRLGDEDTSEQFHVGAWEYFVGYRADKADPDNNDKRIVICVLKKHDFGAAQNIEAGDLRLSLREAENSPEWNPFNPLPHENDPKPKPGEKYSDFETLHIRKSDGVLTAKGQTVRTRQRLFIFTLDWHGNPQSAPAAWFLDLPVKELRDFFKDTIEGAEAKLKLVPEPLEEHKVLLRRK